MHGYRALPREGVEALIDSATLTWGATLSTAERRARRSFEPTSPPIMLNWNELGDRLGRDDGEIRVIGYKGGQQPYGHWQVGDVDLLYRDGRLELRASLPKLLTGRNDVVLDEAAVHAGLRKLRDVGAELIDRPLDLAQATPTRLDYVYQWEVPSVAFVVEHLRSAFSPARKLRTENISPLGGRSITWGYKSAKVIRFYDKTAEVAEKAAKEVVHGLPRDRLEAMQPHERRRAIVYARQKAREQAFKDAELDTVLRYEIQDRRRPRLRLMHEDGYPGWRAQEELERTVDVLGTVSSRDFAALIDSYGDWPHAIAYAAASLHFADHEADLAVVRGRVSRRAYYAWRRRTRQAALAVADWTPRLPPAAFSSGSSLWRGIELAA